MTKFLVEVTLAEGEDNTILSQKLVEMQARGLLEQIIPTKSRGYEGGPTRVLAVTADRPNHNEAAQITLDIFALPGIMSFGTREIVPLLRGQAVNTSKLPRRNRR